MKSISTIVLIIILVISVFLIFLNFFLGIKGKPVRRPEPNQYLDYGDEKGMEMKGIIIDKVVNSDEPFLSVETRNTKSEVSTFIIDNLSLINKADIGDSIYKPKNSIYCTLFKKDTQLLLLYFDEYLVENNDPDEYEDYNLSCITNDVSDSVIKRIRIREGDFYRIPGIIEEDNLGREYLGEWKVLEVIPTDNISVTMKRAIGLSSSGANLLSSVAIIFGNTAVEPVYTCYRINSDKYFQKGYGVEKSVLGIKNHEIKILNIKSTGKEDYNTLDDKPFDFDLIFSDNGKVYTYYCGYFYELEMKSPNT